MPVRGLKAKMFSVYIILILLLFGISIYFIIALFNLGRSINSLMEANYKSIIAARNMVETLDEGHMTVYSYIIDSSSKTLERFENSYENFTASYLKAATNITEAGESEIVKEIDLSLKEYYNSVRQLQDFRMGHSIPETMEFYNGSVGQHFIETKNYCKQLLEINEEAMFAGKSKASENADRSIWVSAMISIIMVILGLALLFYLLSRIFIPIQQLTDSVKLIKEGSLPHKIKINGDDEIGKLASEFNNMTDRLRHFEELNFEKLVSEKNKSLAIVNSISDPIIVTDNDYKIILINPECESVFSISQNDAAGRHLLEVINNKAIFNSVYETLKGVPKNNRSHQDVILLEIRGKVIYYDITVAPILGKDNKINGAVAILQDITHLKEVERLKSDFVSTVSHEFRTPLTSISMGAGMLLDGTAGKISENQREIISVIQEEEQRLAKLVSDLLDLSRIESGKMTVNIKPSSIEDIIKPTIKSLSEQAGSKNIYLEYYIDEKLPMAKADPDKIKVVLTNLIGNAIKFTPQGGKIEVFTHCMNNRMYISVKDNGTGIPREFHDRIFQEFFQGRQGAESGAGTGLGLAIARKIVEIHGGDIWVDSEAGKGSTFTFTLKTV
ncbi:alginate biosynthesis sensor protein KinB [Oxobacter pfennigii]|uniref:histidine kinase n=1 Tax=Oxobacter pfennigii TaxID=36849 RepID=A0A0P8W6U5_9CLOT|nr:ATP-binding protein [Oxobacter pfennigii]KPU43779.1 alginate biosynthesis sensor protein KinB [Oxobacter pfennigii]